MIKTVLLLTIMSELTMCEQLSDPSHISDLVNTTLSSQLISFEFMSIPTSHLLLLHITQETGFPISATFSVLLSRILQQEYKIELSNLINVKELCVKKEPHSMQGTFLSSNWILSNSTKPVHLSYSRNRPVTESKDFLVECSTQMELVYPERKGFHNQLHIRSNCSSLNLFLPQGVYVDADELFELFGDSIQTIPFPIDVEAPFHEYGAVIVQIGQKAPLDLILPIHLRYVLPRDADETYHRSIFIPPLFVKNDTTLLLTHSAPIFTSVPSGNEEDSSFVFFFSFLVLIVSTLLLLLEIILYKYHSC